MIGTTEKIAGGLGAALLLTGFLYKGALEDLASERERCNSEKLAAIAEAEQVARQAEKDAAEERIRQAEELATRAYEALERVQEETRLAAEQPVRVVEAVAESNDACLTTDIPSDVLDSLRDREGS